MSNYQFQVLFDRQSRTYKFNEEVSGKVVLDTRANLTCQQICIDYGWRTHGKGDRDKGGGTTLNLLSEEMQFQSGEHREYPFRFRAPNGPATYHGHILNVDWYVTAHLDVPFRLKIKNEQDFLLIASETPEEIFLGDIRRSKQELPIRSQDVPIMLLAHPDFQPDKPTDDPFSNNRGIGISLVIVIFLFILALLGFETLIFLGLIVVAFLVYPVILSAIWKRNSAIWKRNFVIIDLRVTPSELYLGDRVTYRLQFQTKRNASLDNIVATLSAEEVSVSDDGSSSNTYKHVAYKQSFVKSYTENLVAGRLVYFDGVLPVLPGAPVTFHSSNNDIKWSVKIKITFKRLPSWEKTIPITVLPL